MRVLAAIIILTALVLGSQVRSQPNADERLYERWVRNRPKIDSIVVEGNSYFSESDVKKRLYSRTSNIWRVIRGDRRRNIQRETLSRDSLEVMFLYLSNGFLGVQQSESFEILEPDSSALVRVVVSEGRRFHYGTVTVAGRSEERFLFQGRKIADELKRGKPIDALDVQRATFDMKTYFANNGYPYARVSSLIDTTVGGDTVPVTFTVDQDSLVRFGEVTVTGSDRFPEFVARRELKIKPGEKYRRKDIIDSQRRLYESGYFMSLSLRMVDSSVDRFRPDFALSVRERKSKYVTFRTGAGQSEVRDLLWDVSAGFGKRNFLGSRRYELNADYSFSLGSNSRLITHRYRIRFTEPWLIGIRMPLSLTLEYLPRLKDPVNDFDKRSWSVSASTRKRFGEKVQTGIGFEYQFVKISGVPIEQISLLKELTDNTARRRIFAFFRRDSRDDLFIPTRGVVGDLNGEVYGGFLGGDENFFKFQVSWARFERIWPGWIMATRLKGSWAEPFGESEEVPLDEAIYLGGANTVRGFSENSLGRFEVDGTPVGGRITLVFNQEFRWKTVQVFSVVPFLKDLMKSLPLWQSVFLDVGNGFRNKSDIRWDALAISYGTGLQIVTPAGPVRFDYARHAQTPKIDYEDRWHFTILYAF